MKIRKIIFPLYKKERHGFLTEKWWFRTMTVIYLIAFVVTPFVLFSSYFNDYSGWCYSSLSLYYDDYAKFKSELDNCSSLAREAWKTGLPFAFFSWLIGHYLIQIIFFKVVINYIVLGNKK